MAPTLTTVDGFEFQLFSTTTFAAGGTANYSAATTAAVETTIVKNGAASLKVSPTTSAAGQVAKLQASGMRTGVVSFYIQIASTLPVTDLTIATTAGPTGPPTLQYNATSGKFKMTFSTVVQDFGPVIVADTWYLIDWKFDVSGTTFTATAQVDGNASIGATNTRASQTAADVTTIRCGSSSTTGPAATIYYDDWLIGSTLSDYPFGPHKVGLLKPTSDGTHVTTGSIVEDQAGTVIGASYTTANSLIDEVPPENTDYIKQIAAGTGDYAEVVFASPSEITVWGSTYWCAIEGAATNASDMLLRVVNSGGTTQLDQGGTGAVSGTTRRCSVGYLAGNPSGNKGRMGFASDVSPVPRALTFVCQYAAPTFSDPPFPPKSRGMASTLLRR